MQGISLFFSAYIVALAVQWKLALIVMSIVPAIIVVIVGCIAWDAPVEARIVSSSRPPSKKSAVLTAFFADAHLLSSSSPSSRRN